MACRNDYPQPATLEYTDRWLQRHLDAAVERGAKTVRIPAGRYRMSDSLRLRSNLEIVADGQVVLEKVPSVGSALTAVAGYGMVEFRVAEPDLFHPGMGISIASNQGAGFGTTVARILERDGDAFYIDTPFHRDYGPRNGAMAWSMFPIIAGYGVRNARVRGLTLDGGADDPGFLNGCRGGGVFLLGCREVELTNLEITRYQGDAISFQQCADIWVHGCALHGNAGHGLHPGSGSVRYVMDGNHLHHNGECGIFYCLRTTHSICRDNRIEDNGAEGITLGELDTDHRIEANRIRGNAKAGVAFRKPEGTGADRVVVRGNFFTDNGRNGSGGDLEIGPRLRDIHVLDNQFAPGDGAAIAIAADCDGIILAGNRRGDRPLDAHAVKADTTVQWTTPTIELAVGPQALPGTGGRHLGIAHLPTWMDRPATSQDRMTRFPGVATPLAASTVSD